MAARMTSEENGCVLLQPSVCLCLKDDPSDKRDTERKYQRRAQLSEAVFALADPLTAQNFWVHTDGRRDGGHGAVQTVGGRKRHGNHRDSDSSRTCDQILTDDL